MMTQGVLAFQYEEERVDSGMTALSGLPVYRDGAQVMGWRESIRRHVKVREGFQGGSDEPMMLSWVLFNIAGGEGVEDVRIGAADEGFCQVLRGI